MTEFSSNVEDTFRADELIAAFRAQDADRIAEIHATDPNRPVTAMALTVFRRPGSKEIGMQTGELLGMQAYANGGIAGGKGKGLRSVAPPRQQDPNDYRHSNSLPIGDHKSLRTHLRRFVFRTWNDSTTSD